MAGVNLLFGFIYSWVESSWQVASVVMKYFVLANLAYLVLNRKFTLESFEGHILGTAKPVILGIAVLGLFFSLAEISVTPFFELFSQTVAVLTLGFIFWRY
jgi:hypothetical protein